MTSAFVPTSSDLGMPLPDNASLDARLIRLEANQIALARAMADNTSTTEEVREILAATRMGLRVLGGIGVAAKWIASVGAAIGALYAGYHWMDHH